MPSRRCAGGDDDGDDPLRRRQKKAQAASQPLAKTEDVNVNELLNKAAAAPAKAKPIDYSRFKEIGNDDKEERMKSGNIVWEDLNTDEKKQVWDAHDQYDQILD